MFTSACSLRCAQCAALIALATAAGIARIPNLGSIRSSERDLVECEAVAQPVRTGPTTAAWVQFLRALGGSKMSTRASRPVALLLAATSESGQAISDQPGIRAGQPVHESDNSITPLRFAPVPRLEISSPRRAELARISSAMAHNRLAYAVGPPRSERKTHRHIARMDVSSRSAMRGAGRSRATEARGS